VRRFRKLVAGTEASEIAEAAMVLPIMFMLLIGIFWLGRAFSIYSTITQAAREGARTAVTASCASCAAPGCAWSGSSYPCDTTVVNSISSSLQAAKLDPTRIVAPSPALSPTFCANFAPAGACTTTSNVTVCRGVKLNTGAGAETCGAIVSFRYPMQMTLPLPYAPAGLQSQLQNLNISTQVEMKAEE
jgi:hypothetical protein